ncbi:hypothetical protein SAMN04488018_1082 [Myroides marinus]|uniref:DZANK-type domain-containing protein n=1 Tax=Myroides marinus TaxID=703342 RepID=A0A1H6V7M0_9FLAO|nr:hypothetical protein [Myroides marinus]SEI96275.1 hypothetical protein SAMN04488018_1082 [Myroides marinus]
MESLVRRLVLLIFISIIGVSCNKGSRNSGSYYGSYTDGYSDGTYCAEVEYYNPRTGTSSTYELDVEVEDGNLVQINWPNGGWLDETHFTSEDITSGSCSFSSDRGVEYTVTLLSEGGGCGSGHALQRDVNADIEESTCPDCGGDKDKWDEYCPDCTYKKTKEVCPECRGRKYSWDDYCDDCIYEMKKKVCPSCGGSKERYDDYCSSCQAVKDGENDWSFGEGY